MHLQIRLQSSFFRVKEEDNEQLPDDASSGPLLFLMQNGAVLDRIRVFNRFSN